MKTLQKRLSLIVTACLLLACIAGCGGSGAPASSGGAAAGGEETPADWPTGDITMIVPFAAGGGSDTAARLLARYWEEELGVNVIIENRDGANTEIGNTHFVKNTPDDGTAVMMGVQIYFSACSLFQDADYTIDDVYVLNYMELDPCGIVVRDDSPYETFEDLNAAVLANPGQISVGITAGGDQVIMMEILREQLGWDVRIVNYDGATERLTALLGGHVDAIGTTLAGSLGQAKQIVFCSTERNDVIPDVPTLREVTGDDTLPALGSSRFLGIHGSTVEKYPERVQILLDSLERLYDPSSEYWQAVIESNRDFVSGWYGPDESAVIHRGLHDVTAAYADVLQED